MPQRRGKIYLSQINKWILKTQIQQKEFTYLYTILPKIFLPCDQKWVKVAQSCLTLCDPMDYSPPCSSVHGILQARILEWVAIPFSRGSSQPRGQTQVSCTAGKVFTVWAIREVQEYCSGVATSPSKESSPLRDWTCVSCIGRWVGYLGSPRL